jgi:hypothetical protein
MTGADLLDNWALRSEELEAETLAVFEAELKRRGIGVTAEDRALWRARRRQQVLTTGSGRMARCRSCDRLAGRGFVLAFDLLLIRPLGSMTIYHCDEHEPTIMGIVARIGRWLSNFLCGVRSWSVRAGQNPVRPHHPLRRGAL